MSPSELLNALNPHIAQTRNPQSQRAHHDQQSQPPYTTQLSPPIIIPLDPPQSYLPHRSELEFAITQPPLAQHLVQHSQPPQRSHVSVKEGAQGLQELLRVVYNIRETQEADRRRRLDWERDQEEKWQRTHVELEHRIHEMSDEIAELRSTLAEAISAHATEPPLCPQYVSNTGSGDVDMEDFSQPYPNTHPQQILSKNLAAFSRGDSLGSQSRSASDLPEALQERMRPGKRKVSPDGSETDGECSDISLSSRPPIKRTNHHDKDIYTIHHAMRRHILRMMQISSDKDLPASHSEGIPMGPDDPVRFVWDKTTQQSNHNGRMKDRILEDLKTNRELYKHVPKKDFAKRVLDSVYETSFTNFRTKHKAQTDDLAATRVKNRETIKARKARHLSRRKMKLNNRVEARKNFPQFDHSTFDGAFHLDCMSSEESDVEFSSNGASQPRTIFRTRGYPWRSKRLLQFYFILDTEERANKSGKPKRGSGKHDRILGPPKEGNTMPPQGVAWWMVSRKWMISTQLNYPDIMGVLDRIVVDSPGFDWDGFSDLGYSSERSDDEAQQTENQAALQLHTEMQPMAGQLPQESLHDASFGRRPSQHGIDSDERLNLRSHRYHFGNGTSSLDFALQ